MANHSSAEKRNRQRVTRTGWTPRYLLLEEDGRLLAAMPLWLKTHSWGE